MDNINDLENSSKEQLVEKVESMQEDRFIKRRKLQS